MNEISCRTCRHFAGIPDGAGGGTYYCRKFPGLVLGEWGHWIGNDEPNIANEDCWEGEA